MEAWRPCSTCKKPIPFGADYWVCNVSTCNRVRQSLVFCSVICWDAHVPVMNHRSAWCEERRAPPPPPRNLPRALEPSGRALPSAPRSVGPLAGAALDPSAGRRRLARPNEPEPQEKEVLIVASRLRAYVTEKADMNTAADVLDALSDLVRAETDRAIERAREDGRRTVKGRDYR